MYPTKEEILKTPFEFDKETLLKTTLWKEKYVINLKNKTTSDKLKEIKTLIRLLSPCPKPAVRLGTKYCYDHVGKTVFLDKTHASVISALHELGHHLYGKSELSACRFSVWLFKTIFFDFYEKLIWVDHLLVKKQTTMDKHYNGP